MGASGRRRHVNTRAEETMDSYRFLEENPSLGGEHACGKGARSLLRHLPLPSPAPRAEALSAADNRAAKGNGGGAAEQAR